MNDDNENAPAPAELEKIIDPGGTASVWTEFEPKEKVLMMDAREVR